MGVYKKEIPRLTVKVLDGDDNTKELFEVSGRDHLTVGEFFSDTYLTSLLNQKVRESGIKEPDNVTVIVYANFQKIK